jgi:hypothetical protein
MVYNLQLMLQIKGQLLWNFLTCPKLYLKTKIDSNPPLLPNHRGIWKNIVYTCKLIYSCFMRNYSKAKTKDGNLLYFVNLIKICPLCHL